jgi:hypothetical protein
MLQTDPNQSEFVDFYLPFDGRLQASNRWVKLADIVPWEEVELCYREALSGDGMGAPAMSGRIAFGALVIKERLGSTDEETVEQIAENPYLQYFLGFRELLKKPPFDPSMMVHFRARFGREHHESINWRIIAEATGRSATEPENGVEANAEDQPGKDEANAQDQPGKNEANAQDQPGKNEANAQDQPGKDQPGKDQPAAPPNAGKLLVDATCTPADIRYPTDLSLLNEAREKTEALIDRFHRSITDSSCAKMKKPRTYRQKARKQYLGVAKQKKPGAKKIRKAIGQQLGYVKRNLGHIERMTRAHPGLLASLGRYDYKCLLVIHTLHEQQRQMYESHRHSVADRIVSISQPHVRPIVRGKSGKPVEFGAKISVSHQKEGYVSVDTLSWDAYNESSDLPGQIETYKKRFGYYPSSVHADTIYRTRENRRYCKERGIRLSGKPLGRPKKPTCANVDELKAGKIQQSQDERDRIAVEGKFGNCKRKGTLGRIMAKLAHTSESVILVGIITLNLEKRLRAVLLRLLSSWLETRMFRITRLGVLKATPVPIRSLPAIGVAD